MKQVTAAQKRALHAAIVKAARANSAVFVDAFFGYTSADFHRRWHKAWNQHNANIVQWSAIEHGKTQHAIGWALWSLGKDPVNERILWISSAQTAAKKSTGVIKRAIEDPTSFLRACFPGLKPGDPWTEAAFRVHGASTLEKDHSVETVGVGSTILGGRFTKIVLDDTCTFDTTYTAELRKSMVRWVTSTVLGRLLPGGRILVLGNAWYPDDLMHVLADRGFTQIRDPAYDEDASGRIIPGTILWPERFDEERLGATPDASLSDGKTPSIRKKMGPIEAQRQLRVKPYSAGQGRFDMQWFDKAFDQGRDLRLVDSYTGEWGPAFGGLDLGVQQKEGNDNTAVWIHAKNPQTGKRRLLYAHEERLTGPKIIEMLADLTKRFGCAWKVENNGAQDYIRQFAETKGIATDPFTTGKQKADPQFGIPSLGVELFQGMWILPVGDERSRAMVTTWRTQCLDWTPGAHPGDLLMASFFAREGDRTMYTGEAAAGEPDTTTSADYRLRAAYGPRDRLFDRGGR